MTVSFRAKGHLLRLFDAADQPWAFMVMRDSPIKGRE
jgi:hypothetical protein